MSQAGLRQDSRIEYGDILAVPSRWNGDVLPRACSYGLRVKWFKVCDLVDETGIEPATSSLRTMRSPS
jgi:hypothetical protein